MPKFGQEEFFDEYEIKIGARVYADMDATTWTEKATAESTEMFTEPKYDSDIIDEIDALMNVHYEHLFYKSFEADAGEVFTGTAT